MNRDYESQTYTGTGRETSLSGVGREARPSTSIRDDAARLKEEATRHGAAAYESAKESVRAFGDQAREQVSRYASGQKEYVSESLDEFAQAVRRASDELSQRDQTMAAQFVRQAAGGLESLSRSVSGSSFEDIIGSVRRFGRDHPVAFFGGALLAGLTIGRFARASGQHEDDHREGEDWMTRQEGEEEFAPRPYAGSSYAAGEPAGFASATRAAGDMPPRSQGYAGGGMGTDPVQSSGPSSVRDPSLSASPISSSPAQPGAISTGD
jgi:hypothetical protein